MPHARTPLQRLADRVTALCAVLACVFLVLGLRDTPRVELTVKLPAAPVPAAARTAVLNVAVTTPAEAPVADARVNVFWEREGVEYPVGSTSAGRDGRATLRELPRGAVW